MYLRTIHVENLKRIRDLRLDFTDKDGKPRMWTVLIGENGTAKTSVLHAIALAAAGSQQVNTLAGPVVAHLRDRRGERPLSIDCEFEFTPGSIQQAEFHPELPPLKGRSRNGLRLRSRVGLAPRGTSLSATAEYVIPGVKSARPSPDPLDRAREFHTPRWFVAGYGIARGLPDASYDPKLVRPSIERLEPLFNQTGLLASTSFANHFLRKDVAEGQKRGTTSRIYAKMLNQALKLGGSDLLPDIVKLELRGRGGTTRSSDFIESDRFHQRMGEGVHAMAGVALSHGYQSTFAWIADLIGHVLLESHSELQTAEMEGLVLLDEIDLYLHPIWQATFITALRRVFPRMQFIATTHSPVVLAELTAHEIIRLRANPETGDVEQVADAPDPRPMTGSEIYRQWFGVDRLTPNPHGKDLRDYLVLADDPYRSSEDEKRLMTLAKRLRDAGISDIGDPVKRRKGH